MRCSLHQNSHGQLFKLIKSHQHGFIVPKPTTRHKKMGWLPMPIDGIVSASKSLASKDYNQATPIHLFDLNGANFFLHSKSSVPNLTFQGLPGSNSGTRSVREGCAGVGHWSFDSCALSVVLLSGQPESADRPLDHGLQDVKRNKKTVT